MQNRYSLLFVFEEGAIPLSAAFRTIPKGRPLFNGNLIARTRRFIDLFVCANFETGCFRRTRIRRPAIVRVQRERHVPLLAILTTETFLPSSTVRSPLRKQQIRRKRSLKSVIRWPLRFHVLEMNFSLWFGHSFSSNVNDIPMNRAKKFPSAKQTNLTQPDLASVPRSLLPSTKETCDLFTAAAFLLRRRRSRAADHLRVAPARLTAGARQEKIRRSFGFCTSSDAGKREEAAGLPPRDV